MPFLNHVRLTDKLVDAPRPCWKSEEMVIVPAMDCVVLHVRKWMSVYRDYPSRNAGVCQFHFITGLI